MQNIFSFKWFADPLDPSLPPRPPVWAGRFLLSFESQTSHHGCPVHSPNPMLPREVVTTILACLLWKAGPVDRCLPLCPEPGTERGVGILRCLPSGVKEKPTLAAEFRALSRNMLGIMVASDLGCLEHRHSLFRRVDHRVWAWLTRVRLGW